jgi:tetratricopeptide (TPR) repeat protein
MTGIEDEFEARKLARFEQALALGHGREPGKAIEQLEMLLPEVRDSEDRGYILLYEALFLARTGKTADARERLRGVADLWERTPEHDVRIEVFDALLDEAEGRPASALRKLNAILARFSTLRTNDDVRHVYEEIQFSRGRLLTTLADWRLALPILEECLTFERPKPDEYFYVNLGICYFENKHWDKAEEALKYSLTKDLDANWKSAARYYLGRAYYSQGGLAKAMKEFELALAESTAAGTSPKLIYDALAKVNHHLGLDAEAAQYARLAKST